MTALSFDNETFKKSVKALALHASTDNARPTLTGILFEDNAMVATDSYTMAYWEPMEQFSVNVPFIVPAKELLNAIKPMKGKTITLSVENTTWEVSDGLASAKSELISSEFPAWRNLLPNGHSGDHFAETRLSATFMRRLSDASLAIHKDHALVLDHWESPIKPILFTTTTNIGCLTQLICPIRKA